MRRRITTAARRVGRRGASLAFFALLHIAIAISLQQVPDAAARLYVISPDIWSTCWAVTAGICLAGIVLTRFDAVAFAASMSMMVAWSVLSFHVYWVHPTATGWLGPIVWFAFAGFIWVISGWPEP